MAQQATVTSIPAPSRRVPGEYPFYPKKREEGAIYVHPECMEVVNLETNETSYTIDYSKKFQ